MTDMTKKKRVRAVIDGKCPDRIPVSFFQHNHAKEKEPRILAGHMLEVNRRYDWDFIRIQSRNSYYAEAWGCKFQWSPGAGPEMQDCIIKSVQDFRSLKPIPPTEGVFAEHVAVARLLGEELAGTVTLCTDYAEPTCGGNTPCREPCPYTVRGSPHEGFHEKRS